MMLCEGYRFRTWLTQNFFHSWMRVPTPEMLSDRVFHAEVPGVPHMETGMHPPTCR
jgi:hypothetical protein